MSMNAVEKSMSYKSYLLVMSQLSSSKKACITIQDRTIHIDASSKKNCWRLCTKIFDGEGNTPHGVRACLSSTGLLRWEQGKSHLKYDSLNHVIYLIEDIAHQERSYIPFKYHIEDFIKVSQEWQEILEQLSTIK